MPNAQPALSGVFVALASLARAPVRAALFGAVALATGACAPSRIPNTDVPDTRENRDVIEIAEQYRRAVEQRDTRALLALTSPNYFEDGGTPAGDDDYGIEGLRRLLSIWSEEVRAVRYEVRYRRVSFDRQDRANVDFTYTGSFTLRRAPLHLPPNAQMPRRSALNLAGTDPTRAGREEDTEGEVWFRRVADNRLELEKRDGHWMIVAGM
jgi:hypothetical protein